MTKRNHKYVTTGRNGYKQYKSNPNNVKFVILKITVQGARIVTK